MKLAHFRQIVGNPVAKQEGVKLSVKLKNGEFIDGDWSWFKGPGEIIVFERKGRGAFSGLVYVEIEEITYISLNREGAKS